MRTETRTETETTDRERGDDYDIRWFREGDKAGFMDLHRETFPDGTDAWFDWKFLDNPYLPETPIVVTEHDGDIVGARPNLAFQMRAGDTYHTALQSCDTMVHEDHRRQGLFSRMSERLFADYADGQPEFTFNNPNPLTTAGLAKLGCEIAGEHTTYYRVQNPAVYAGIDNSLAEATGERAARAYLGVRERRFDPPDEVSVTSHTDIPAGTLATLYRRRPPSEIHAYRDEQFFDYRFGNPNWEYTSYTATLGDRPVAGVVAGTGEKEGHTVTNVVDVLPLVGDDERDRALPAIFDRLVTDYADSDVVAVRGESVPHELLTGLGFHSDQDLPLAPVATPTRLIVSPIPPDGTWRVAGRDIREMDNWRPTFVEHNTA
ncbi:GNAT family N-acetyltransferase [Haloarcula onubensis]|uniref:GNAT family N-acetyltransferase n=1 Tax=Haloarcula onubensis TaxID=2950539 RepID=A0ABU2FPD3_9EURY|nr:GNAT family N-acetyltransferase [Halomicroarcula sp. S3CR25-11]MDS0282112.1 GNAT family N-acetyltransferase [Halomicroarcula sp. S3CR25-11]